MRLLSTQELREIQLIALRDVVAFCARNHLQVLLAYGSLLGAVRHRGYIPWDDDIDLMMPRADYERFRLAYRSPRFTLGNPGEGDWDYPYVKVIDNSTVATENAALKPRGVSIDLFPLDHYADSLVPRLWQVCRSRAYLAARLAKVIVPSNVRSFRKSVLLRLAKLCLGCVSTQRLSRQADQSAARQHGQRVGVLVGSYLWHVPAAAIKAGDLLEFEGLRVAAPDDTAAVLTAMYGPTYLQPPPEALRITHHEFMAVRR